MSDIYVRVREEPGCFTYLFGILTVIVGIGMFISKVGETLINWQEYTFVNKIVAGIYYFIVYLPVKFIFSPWDFIVMSELTQFNKINIILAIIVNLIFAILFICLILLIASLKSRSYPILDGTSILIALYTVPFIVWLISLFIKWLFT